MGLMPGALNDNFQTTLDGSGNGTLTIGPANSYQTWVLKYVAVSLTSNVKEPVLKMYQGKSAGTANYLTGSYTPSNDQSDMGGMLIHPGDSIYCVWTGGDAGAVATVTASGDLQVP